MKIEFKLFSINVSTDDTNRDLKKEMAVIRKQLEEKAKYIEELSIVVAARDEEIDNLKKTIRNERASKEA